MEGEAPAGFAQGTSALTPILPPHRANMAHDVSSNAHLRAIDAGDPKAADRLLPLVYDELRKLAAARMAAESPGQTLEATALVHEAYLRLVETPRQQEREVP